MSTVRDHNPPPVILRPVNRRDRRWWTALILVVVLSFGVLLYMGHQIQVNKPPIPTKVVDTSGRVLMTGAEITEGQNVWQSIGGQEIGSVWGHGAYVAPDWTADTLHRELTYVLDQYAKKEGAASYDSLDPERQAALKARLKANVRTNTYDPATGVVTIDPLRAEAWRLNSEHYAQVFSQGNVRYAIQAGALTDPTQLQQMSDFFWWSSWAASTNAPNSDATYLQNWPHEPLIDNVPTSTNVLWSIISFILLLGGIAGMVWYHNYHADDDEPPSEVPDRDPLLGYRPTPSQKATIKYFYVVGALFVAQIGVGILSAHYGVEGGSLYGIPIDKVLPYAVTRTWHTQLGILWIATAWLATGLYVSPAVGGREPKYQRLGVNVLFWALIVVVAGSMVGEWLSIMGYMGHGLPINWWLGTTGMEYLDLARVWQIGLFIGLFLWFFLMARGMWPALKRARSGEGNRPTDTAPLAAGGQRTLILMLLMSSLAIASFFGAAFGMDRGTHLSITEYWRWWVVHLWVEGFFEVFATVVIAFLFARLGLIRSQMAATATLASTAVYLAGGIIGTGHHLYFTGADHIVMAWSATFSALEVVPLALVGFEAFKHLRLLKVSSWAVGYKWAVYFFVAVSFWNMLGAGVFGFLINPPISLFYVQGLNLTALHAHTALFGVYGMLGIGLMMFVMRSLMPGKEWNERWIAIGFWGLNVGLLLMALLSLLPLGMAQAWASITHGLWYARSSDFLYTPALTVLRWMRTPGDIVFTIGGLSIGVFMVGLLFGYSVRKSGGEQITGSVFTQLDEEELEEVGAPE
ncbi:nitric oxide reductase, NorZ apoprotein [Raineyella antarctica]|uniref:Nitric oxide reductase, NorZ apoprotein n=1 Tax=Raineyella antarctica TaxID=1577474 RepID=A0A1G6HE87_9ACTN|nr:nitric-oxide reductase large subunit [Raineyella antarctica]SDB92570.1 nitric oxide reductase, NorZ apoprotein [Raineyella antarctica]